MRVGSALNDSNLHPRNHGGARTVAAMAPRPAVGGAQRRAARSGRGRGLSVVVRAADFYDVLGVPRNADKKTIKQAYRSKARKYHPVSPCGGWSAGPRMRPSSRACSGRGPRCSAARARYQTRAGVGRRPTEQMGTRSSLTYAPLQYPNTHPLHPPTHPPNPLHPRPLNPQRT